MSYKSVKQECLTRALRNSVKQGCPTRVSPQCVRSGCPTSGFAGKCDKYCFCSSTHVSAFGFVGFILFYNWFNVPESRQPIQHNILTFSRLRPVLLSVLLSTSRQDLRRCVDKIAEDLGADDLSEVCHDEATYLPVTLQDDWAVLVWFTV